MTDLDTFAAAALEGLLADQSLGDLGDTTLATRAYELAAAMIEERERVTELLPKEKRAEVSLTPEEREAIKWFSQLSYGDGGPLPTYCATLRALLERLK